MTRFVLTSLILWTATVVSGRALADTVWAAEDVVAQRWVDDADVTVGTVEQGARLDVVYREAGWVRVRIAALDRFGWLPETAVTTVEPEAPVEPDEPRRGLDFSTTLPPINLDIP